MGDQPNRQGPKPAGRTGRASSTRRSEVRARSLQQLPCPLCGAALEPARGRHGLVWLCHACRGGAATLPILRQVAPRTFVNRLWQAALHGGGRRSRRICPSCSRPFTLLVGAGARVDVCVLCFWVWLGPSALSSLAGRPQLPPPLPGPLEPTRRIGTGPRAPRLLEAPRALGRLAAGVIRDAR